MIRKILVPVRGDGKGDNVFAHAAMVAKRFHAHVVVNYCRARPQDMIPFGVPVPAFVREQIEESAVLLSDQEEAKLREEFEVLSTTLGLTITDTPTSDVATATFASRAGRQIDVIKEYGRLADLITVAKPDRDRNLGGNTLKAALFNTGRPVMMCPPTSSVSADICNHVVIAWNGSTEVSRAVALNMTILENAEKITVLTAGAEEPHGASSEELIEDLSLRGITANLERFETKKNKGGNSYCSIR